MFRETPQPIRDSSEEEIQTLVLKLSLLVSSLGPKHAGEEENQQYVDVRKEI